MTDQPTMPGPGEGGRRGLAEAAAAAAVLAALTAFAAFGLLGLGWDGRLGEVDFGHFYVAGIAWATGQDPYDPAQYQQIADATFAGNERYRVTWTILSPFFYPPTSSTLVVPLAALPADAARLVVVVMNALAALGVAVYLGLAARRLGASRALALLSVAVALGSSAVAANVWMGQTSLLTVAAVCAAWACRDSGRYARAGAFAALATVKPSISAFVVLALLLGRGRLATAAGLAAGALLLSSAALLSRGPVETTTGWLGVLGMHGDLAVNQPSNPQTFGLRSLLAAFGLEACWSAAIAPIGFAWAWWRRDVMNSLELLGVCLALPVLFIQAHGYDLVALLPLIAAALVAAGRSGSPAAMVATLAAAAVAAVPGRALRMASDWPPSWRIRELVLLALLAGFVAAIERRAAAARRRRRAAG